MLDRNLGKKIMPEMLRAGGFDLVTHCERYGSNDQKIMDPQLIADCGTHKNVLITADADLETSFAAEINAAKIAVILLSNNHDGPILWGPRIVAAKASIELELSRRRKPFLARLTAEGRINQIRMYYRRKTRVIRFRR